MKFDEALELLGVQRGTTVAAIEQRYDRLVAALSDEIDQAQEPSQEMKLQARLMEVVSAMEIVRLTVADDPDALTAPPTTEGMQTSDPATTTDARDDEQDETTEASSDDDDGDSLDTLLRKQIEAREDRSGTRFLTDLPLEQLRRELDKSNSKPEETPATDSRSDESPPKAQRAAHVEVADAGEDESVKENPVPPSAAGTADSDAHVGDVGKKNQTNSTRESHRAGRPTWALPTAIGVGVLLALVAGWLLVGDEQTPAASSGQASSGTEENDAINAFLEAQARLTGQVTALREARDRAANERLLLEQQLMTLEENTTALPEAQQQLFAEEITSVRSALERNNQRIELLEKFVTGGALKSASEMIGKPPSQIDASLSAALDKLNAQVRLSADRARLARELDQALAARTVLDDHLERLADYGIQWPPRDEWTERLDGSSKDPETTLVEANLALAQGRFVDAASRFADAAAQATSVLAMAEKEESLTSDRILALEALAETALEEKRLTSPASDNALLYYQQILAMDPENTFADQGLERIQEAYLGLINRSLADNDIDGALSFANKARQVKRGSDAMHRIDERIETYYNQLDSRLAETINEARRMLDEGRLREFAAQVALLRDEFGNSDEADRLEAQRAELLGEPGYRFEEHPGLWMVVVPSGSFEMGYSGRRFLGMGGARNELPRHPVVFERPVAIAEKEVTVALFRAFAESNPMATLTASQENRMQGPQGEQAAGADWTRDFTATASNQDDAPVLFVSHATARAFARWLANQTAAPYRLVTESEFEYVLRAGSMSRYPWGDDLPDPSVGNLLGMQDTIPQGWSGMSSQRNEIGIEEYEDGHFGPAPIASFPANAYGLYDMVGNVAEWTADCYIETFDNKGSDGHAVQRNDCNAFSVRGSSWRTPADNLRSSFRQGVAENVGTNWIGFRVARDLDARRQ